MTGYADRHQFVTIVQPLRNPRWAPREKRSSSAAPGDGPGVSEAASWPPAPYVVKLATGAVIWERTLAQARRRLDDVAAEPGPPLFPATIWRFDLSYPYSAYLVEEHPAAVMMR